MVKVLEENKFVVNDATGSERLNVDTLSRDVLLCT